MYVGMMVVALAWCVGSLSAAAEATYMPSQAVMRKMAQRAALLAACAKRGNPEAKKRLSEMNMDDLKAWIEAGSEPAFSVVVICAHQDNEQAKDALRTFSAAALYEKIRVGNRDACAIAVAAPKWGNASVQDVLRRVHVAELIRLVNAGDDSVAEVLCEAAEWGNESAGHALKDVAIPALPSILAYEEPVADTAGDKPSGCPVS